MILAVIIGCLMFTNSQIAEAYVFPIKGIDVLDVEAACRYLFLLVVDKSRGGKVLG